MTKRFTYELVVGILLLIAIVLFGTKGLAVMALLAVHPFIGKKKADERELQLFYRIGNITAGATLLACIVVYYFSDFVINGVEIGKNWLGFVVGFFLLVHGLAGMIVISKN